ncbi:hypothetical protein Vadar_017712 [Vaccinium darrowii]|uniref:Uncharacterized protein n=1 Tax=Vaccinium darrowii TaxID=229202 RepID=A0ACB7YGF5_9ERIC|nr:hypothetical protein Vadar_017712 [Vaccinium darrowii]
MGNWFSKAEPLPPVVLVPPLFDSPPLAARTMMLESSYNLLFGKLPLRCLFEDYFEEARHFSTRIMLKPIDDPHVDLIATVSRPLDHEPKENILGTALFRWQSDVYNPHTFMDVFVSNTDPVYSEDGVVVGLRYGSSNLSIGVTLMPFSFRSRGGTSLNNLENWSCAIGYGLGSASLLSPSFNFGLELARSSQVKNPFAGKEVVGIMNYIDFGFELQTRTSSRNADSTFQVAASWQANKNFLVKGKAGPLSSSIALAFKPWCKPSFTFNVSATGDHTSRNTSYGFSIRVDNLREAASYERADLNSVRLTSNKEHLAEGIQWKHGKRPVLQSDIDSENSDGSLAPPP